MHQEILTVVHHVLYLTLLVILPYVFYVCLLVLLAPIVLISVFNVHKLSLNMPILQLVSAIDVFKLRVGLVFKGHNYVSNV